MDDNIVFGKIPVKNAITGNRKPVRVFLNTNHPDADILSLARTNSLPVKMISQAELNRLSLKKNHQGVIFSMP